jgi:hypothetical protein
MFSENKQKLALYLLKSTIGQILQDINWNDLDFQLLQGLITLQNASFNLQLINQSLQPKGYEIISGKIKSIQLAVPWSSFLVDPTKVIFSDVEIEICKIGIEIVKQNQLRTLMSHLQCLLLFILQMVSFGQRKWMNL